MIKLWVSVHPDGTFQIFFLFTFHSSRLSSLVSPLASLLSLLSSFFAAQLLQHAERDAERAALEEKILGRSIDDIWNDTRAFFERRDPAQIGKAEGDPKHTMALVFRWYLFMGAQWARSGETDRRTDYQIWCGPAMGAFKEWVKGSFLEPVESRSVVQIALNLLEGAAHVTRAHQLRLAGVPLGHRASQFSPRPLR